MKALVISGGVAEAAWAVGVVKHLVDTKGQRYDLVVGTSGGAVVAWGAALHDTTLLHEAYANARKRDFLTPRNPLFGWSIPLNVLWALVTGRDSAYKVDGFRRQLEQRLDESRWARLTADPDPNHPDRVAEVVVCTTCLQSAQPTYISARDKGVTREGFIQALLATSAVPCFLPRQQIPGHPAEWFVDGGVRDNLPVGYAIRRGADEVDAIMLQPPEREYETLKPFRRITEVAERTAEMFLMEVEKTDLRMAEFINAELLWRRRLHDKVAELAGTDAAAQAFATASSGGEPMQSGNPLRPYAVATLRLFRIPEPLGDPLDIRPDLLQSYITKGEEHARSIWP
jgi:NTE family protein